MNSGRLNSAFLKIKQLKNENETLTRKLMHSQNNLDAANAEIRRLTEIVDIASIQTANAGERISELEGAIDEIQEQWSGDWREHD